MTAILRTPKDWPAVLLGRAGAVDPTNLDEAVQAGAFEGLRRAIRELGPEGTIAEVEASGLRGRGGAGHLTASKWRAAAGTEARERYVVANGYGADPAAGTDRTLIETDPYAVIMKIGSSGSYRLGRPNHWAGAGARTSNGCGRPSTV